MKNFSDMDVRNSLFTLHEREECVKLENKLLKDAHKNPHPLLNFWHEKRQLFIRRSNERLIGKQPA